MSDLQVIWEIGGDLTFLVEKLSLDYPNESPRISVHVGEDDYNVSQRKGDRLKLLLAPDQVPNPVLALAYADVFGYANVYPVKQAPALLVDGAFMGLVEEDTLESCVIYDALGMLVTNPAIKNLSRRTLLDKAPVRERLFLINPTHVIPVEEPIDRDRLLFVPGDVHLPPFFRVPWNRSGVYIRDDIRQRLDRAGMVGQVYNLLPYALQRS